MIPVAVTPDLPAAPRPPALLAPAPYEASFGRVAGSVSPGTVRIVVHVGGRRVAERELQGASFSLTVPLPRADTEVRVTAVGADGNRAATTVGPVYGLPAAGLPRGFRGREDHDLARRALALARAFPGTSAVYVQDLVTGRGAAWNARARFPAASTLKLAIAIAVLARSDGPPPRGSALAALLREAIAYSDNEAANSLEVWLGGSQSGGSAIVDATMRALGLVDSEMYGGYILGTDAARPIPLRVESAPAFGRGKYTTAHDLARMLTLVHQAAGGKGPLLRRIEGVTPSEARWLLYLLAHAYDHGKLDRFVRVGGVGVAHKSGFIEAARHDAGIVYWPGGAFVAVVLTYGPGVGTRSDILAGRVAEAGLRRFRALARRAAYDWPSGGFL